MKIFNRYEIKDVQVTDTALQKYINLDEKLVLKSRGIPNTEKFGKGKINIVERFIGMIGVPGHRGKKHKIQTSQATGKYSRNAKIILETLRVIEEKTKQNPVQVLIKAIENSAPCDEVTTIEYGGARYPQAVDVSPLRRISVAIRNIIRGGYDKAFNKKATIAQGLAAEIIAASQNTGESFAAQKRNESEKQADSAR